MRRLFRCSISLNYEDEHGDASVSSFIADRTEFWWNERKPDQPTLWKSTIYLGEAFFNEIIQHPVPLDMNTLTSLKRCSLGLDLYLWLVYRTFTLRAPLRLTWRQVYRQFGADPARAKDHRIVQKFRVKVLRELKKIKLGLAGLELHDGQRDLDPLALNPRHRTFGSSSTSKLGRKGSPLTAPRVAGVSLGSPRHRKPLLELPTASYATAETRFIHRRR